MSLLEASRDERGIRNWAKPGIDTGGLASFGIGLTRLRKLAKGIGRDHRLAMQLWRTGNHDAKALALMIDEPDKLTREQAEEQVGEVGAGILAHVFSCCDATLAKAPFAFELTCDWIAGDDPLRRRCGYGLLYELSKNRRMEKLTDAFFLSCIGDIRSRFPNEGTAGRLAMGNALMGIGKRNRKLNEAALELAHEIGPIDFNDGNGTCGPFDVAKHLTSEYLRKKLAM